MRNICGVWETVCSKLASCACLWTALHQLDACSRSWEADEGERRLAGFRHCSFIRSRMIGQVEEEDWTQAQFGRSYTVGSRYGWNSMRFK